MKPQTKALILDRQGKFLFCFMVVVSYIVTFAFNAIDQVRVTDENLFWGIALGGVYLFLGLNNHMIFKHLPAGWADLLFFSLMCSLVFGIGHLLGIGGTVLIAVPLVGFAVERLKLWQRIVMYIALVAAVVTPIGLRYEMWLSALINGITISVVIMFLDMFAQLRLNEQLARERVELLLSDLEQANTQLAAYAAQAEELVMTQERNRLAREIHDNLGHTLTIVNVQIEAAKVVMQSEPKRALDALNKAQKLTQKGLTQVRKSVASLRESPVSNRPLSEAIRSLVEETQRAGIVTEFKVVGQPQTLENKVALAFYRVVQEGLTNVCKHARASRVDVLLSYKHTEVRLEVKDNGVGTTETIGGFGLLGIRERMRLIGGKLEILTAAGKGFCLIATVPLVTEVKQIKREE